MTGGDLRAAETGTRTRRTALALIVAFWTLNFTLLSAARLAQYPENFLHMAIPRLLVTAAAIVISLAILQIHQAVGTGSLLRRLTLTIITAAVACVLHFTINYCTFWAFGPKPLRSEPFVLSEFSLVILDWFWTYLGLSAILMTLRYHAGMVERDLQLARLETLAREAQLRALRYQLNPHFLFNALNSVAALIARDAGRTAENMVENLADFLRAGLAIDAADQIPLAREIALQQLYLDVEAVRFPDRLVVAIDVPDAIGDVLVPSLMLQPLVENTIKYAVANSSQPVHLRIWAESLGDRLHIVVENDGGDDPRGTHAGTGVGLNNVRERLRGLFGDEYRFNAGPRRSGGFRVSIELPLRRAT